MSDRSAGRTPRPEAWRLGLLFGAISFLQGIGEPTEGLIAQPARALLTAWGQSASEITGFVTILTIPWSFKPLYGLLTDFVPLFGTRRKGYLLLAAGATTLSLLGLVVFPVTPGASVALLGWLLLPAVAMALADVAADALMIEWSQPLGLTGSLQAVQWGCLYAAGIVTGLLGAELCERHLEYTAFLVCSAGGLLTFLLVCACIREPARAGLSPKRPASLRTILTARPVIAVGAFLFLWNFNPFSNAILHLHMTRAMGLSERFYGITVALTAAVSIAASAAYTLYCTRIAMTVLVHASIALGVLSTLGYAWFFDERSAILVTLCVGFTYMTATLIQLDLAARTCPAEVAGTVFAGLMALENLSASASTRLGGFIYDRGLTRWGSERAFQVLVLIGSALTACCWFVVPFLPRLAMADVSARRASAETPP